MPSRKTIAVYDYNTHGHHPSYLALISKLLLRQGYDVWLMCGCPDLVRQSLNLRPEDEPLLHRITSVTIKPPAIARGMVRRNLRLGLQSWREAAGHIHTTSRKIGREPDFLFLLSAADFSRGWLRREQVDRIYPKPWGALMIHLMLPFVIDARGIGDRARMALQYHRPKYYHSLDIYNSRHCRFFLTLQEDCLNYLADHLPGKAHLFPDISSEEYTEDHPVLTEIKAKAGGRKIITLVGNQNERKGTFMMLEVAKRCRDRDWFFLFAGKDDYVRGNKSEQSLVQKIEADKEQYDNCYIFMDKIEEKVFNGLFVISDLLFVLYKDFPFSSNILTKAALFNKFVISSPRLVGERTEAYRLGRVCPFGDIDACIAGIAEIFGGQVQNPDFAGYYAKNSLEHASRLLHDLIECGDQKLDRAA